MNGPGTRPQDDPAIIVDTRVDALTVLTPNELGGIARLLAHLGPPTRPLRLRRRDNSPWLEIDILADVSEVDNLLLVTEQAAHFPATEQYAIWTYTGGVYPIDRHGAAADDPINFKEEELRR